MGNLVALLASLFMAWFSFHNNAIFGAMTWGWCSGVMTTIVVVQYAWGKDFKVIKYKGEEL